MDRASTPVLVIVSGPPASGKTSIGSGLASELRLPLFAKDSFKEFLADQLKVAGFTWSRALGAASFEILYLIAETELKAGKSLIIEGNFSGEAPSERLRTIVRETNARAVEVNIRANGELLVKRYEERRKEGGRHPIHVDGPRSQATAFRSGLLRGGLPPLDLEGDVIQVDTSNFDEVDIRQIAAQIRHRLKRSGAPIARSEA